MGIFFWDFTDCNDTPRYNTLMIERQYAMFFLNLLVFGFITIAVVKTYCHYRRCIFQLFPLTVNLIAAFILLLLKLFEKGYQFDEIGHLIEIFTYFLFCHTFALMYSRVLPSRYSNRRKKIWNVILVIFFLGFMVFSILIFTGFISNKCKNQQTQKLPTQISLGFQFVSFFPTIFYGYRILASLTEKQKQSDDQLDPEISLLSSKQQYIRQRKKQIKMVLFAYFFGLILRIIITLLSITLYDSLFTCVKTEEGVYILSGTIPGQIILIFAQIDQLLPHVVIPIAMYVIPLKKYSATTIIIDDKYEEDEDEERQNKETQAAQQISSMLSSRLSSNKSKK